MAKYILAAMVMFSTQGFASEFSSTWHSQHVDAKAGKEIFGLEKKKDMYVGEVIEILNAGNYSYLKVDKTGAAKKTDPIWAAVYKVDFATGTMIRFPLGKPMKDFHSKSLNRKFSKVYFLSEYEVGKLKKKKS